MSRTIAISNDAGINYYRKIFQASRANQNEKLLTGHIIENNEKRSGVSNIFRFRIQ